MNDHWHILVESIPVGYGVVLEVKSFPFKIHCVIDWALGPNLVAWFPVTGQKSKMCLDINENYSH